MAADQAESRLASIRHIVVLMMENRSFDHMLGYLRHAGLPEVNGFAGDETNTDEQGNVYRVFPYPPGETAFHRPGQPFDDSLDPCHSPECVAEQLKDGNGGFVKNFISYRNPPAEHRGLPMGHYTAEHLPVYDFLARNFCVCDAWHSSIPGDTWPNRLYSLAARTADPVTHKLSIFQHLLGTSIWSRLQNIPIYEVEAFTRQLEDSQWRWYSHDPATLRGADERYRDFSDLDRDNFAYFDRKEIGLALELAETPIVSGPSFLDDAANGELRQVSWIDPNFVNLRVFDSISNDDHPPSDVLAGQQLVLDLYDALSKTPAWEDTLLVITYDEHGGFYDHVAPPPVDDDPDFATLGLRVPAIVAGPRVRNFVCHDVFDHTSLIATVLRRFAAHPDRAVAAMPPRVATARTLGTVLGDAPRTDIPAHDDLHDRLARWRVQARRERTARPQAPSRASDGAGQELVLHEFQDQFVKFSLTMRHLGLPPGRP